MFTDKGEWKEFGIGRDRAYFTPFPFWMFVFLWALLSYLVSRILFKIIDKVDIVTTVQPNKIGEPPGDLTPGYYVLNKNSARRGAPRYVYYGKTAPPDFA